MSSSSSSSGGLNVIALVSGGKDSFFSALHCLENGHRLVALANLHPPLRQATRGGGGGGKTRPSGEAEGEEGAEEEEGEQDETDLNSFMYQTVGHQVIPLYADATGLPLYRQPILGGAVQGGREYSTARAAALAAAAAEEEGGQGREGPDETESLVPLLRTVLARHPEANALSAGAILSTYQRTRVESVALRLGLVPLAYLWNYPVLPPPPLSPAGGGSVAADEAQLLLDMAAAGLEARIIKVASGGLDEGFLWEDAAAARGIARLKRAMGRFGSAALDTGAVLGEGGEFETLVVDGPGSLFRRRLVVDEGDRRVVREGGGMAWLRVGRARVEEKTAGGGGGGGAGVVRRPELLDERFRAVVDVLSSAGAAGAGSDDDDDDDDDHSLLLPPLADHSSLPDQLASSLSSSSSSSSSQIQTWAITTRATDAADNLTIQQETSILVGEIRTRLVRHSLPPAAIISTIVILRSMADFPAVNAIYGALFTEPNPPSRVTISCGPLLPPGAGNIAIYLTLPVTPPASPLPFHHHNHTGLDRQGLHVQSRSYWAPANIGPYSQAIIFAIPPAAAAAAPAPAKVVHIAGQIPLVPATMDLPASGMDVQLALSLQHLWRIGTELRVRWWTSAAVYLPRSGATTTTTTASSGSAHLSVREKAQMACHAWKQAHTPSSTAHDDDDDDETGPDLWDRKFDPRYMSYTGETASPRTTRPDLPDYTLLDGGENSSSSSSSSSSSGRRHPRPMVPFCFAAEVDELPRSAEAEWHAHAGLACPDDARVRVWRERRQRTSPAAAAAAAAATEEPVYQAEHCAVLHLPPSSSSSSSSSDATRGVCLHSLVAVEASPAHRPALVDLTRRAGEIFDAALARCGAGGVAAPPTRQGQRQGQRPYLVYLDAGVFAAEEIRGAVAGDEGLAVVPCASLWGGASGGGGGVRRLAMVVLYRAFGAAAAEAAAAVEGGSSVSAVEG